MEDIITKIQIIAAKKDYKEIVNATDYYVTNAMVILEQYKNYKIGNDDIDYLINLLSESSNSDSFYENMSDQEQESINLNFSENFKNKCKTEHQRNFVDLLYNLIAQIDMNAANKSHYNPKGIVVIGKTGIRQNIWVENLLKYKKEYNYENINSNNIRNCLEYLNNTETKYPILQENHYRKIKKYIPDLLNNDWNICKNKKNNTYLIKEILYKENEIRNKWEKKDLEDIEPYEVASIVMYILKENENKILCSYDDLKKHPFTKKILETKEQTHFKFPTVIDHRINDEDSYITKENNYYKLTEQGIQKSRLLYEELHLDYITKTHDNGDNNMKQPLNQILYGPPGTGKTYNTVVKAMEIIGTEKVNMKDNEGNFRKIYSPEEYKVLREEFNECKKQGQIEFVTFHQSYSYEEFVEGIKPYIPDWGEKNVQDVKYVGKDGIFKKMCCASIQDKYNYFKKMYDNGELGEFKTDKGKNYIISKFDDKTFEISRIDGTPNSCTIEKFKNVIFYEGDDLKSTNLRKKAGVGNGLEMNLVEIRDYVRNLVIPPNEVDKKVLIIDEINRGNISKIFGELITLIEEDKRENVTGEDKEYNTIKVRLPYSGDEFSVPNNLYIIGTMNTADKSLALLDVALRRRFEFVPVYPKYKEEIHYENKNYSDILKELNNQILIKKNNNADYLIGHSYFLGKEPIEDIFNNKVIPLLMEYFNGKIDEVYNLLYDNFTITFDPNYITPEGEKTKCKYYYLQVKKGTEIAIKGKNVK